jgi:hypothetical protein
MAQGAVQAGADNLEQLGDILTFGANHDHPQMQEVWQRQRERGQALGRLASDPTGAVTDMMESVAHRYGAANAITDNDYERSRQLGYLFNDVGQGLLGAGTALRGASRLGAAGGEVLGENALSGPLAGGRAAQRGGVEVGVSSSGGVLSTEGQSFLQSAEASFKGQHITNAGRATTKHPEYFGFNSTDELRAIYRTDAQLNELASNHLNEILANGIRTAGAGGRYPNGWVTYTLSDGRAASWSSSGEFIGFRGLQR